MNKNLILNEIRCIRNPYPKEVFLQDNKEKITLTRGRLNKLLHDTHNKAINSVIKQIEEVE